jgi:hypothetical protein
MIGGRYHISQLQTVAVTLLSCKKAPKDMAASTAEDAIKVVLSQTFPGRRDQIDELVSVLSPSSGLVGANAVFV